MSFSPIILNPFSGSSKYIPLPTQAFAASSSMGSVQLGLLQNNQEWQYHFVNSQQLINTNSDTISQIWQEADFPRTLSRRIGSYGPFRINLDKNNQPQPLEIYFNGFVQDNYNNFRMTGAFTFSLRGYGEYGPQFKTQVLTLVTTSISYSVGTGYKNPWASLTTSLAPIGYTVTDSIGLMRMNSTNIVELKTKSTKSLSIPDVSQKTYLGYLDIFFGINSYNIAFNGNPMYVTIKGLYVREVCGWQQ